MKEINVVVASQDRLEAITEMAKAIHQLALALNVPLVMVKDNEFSSSEGGTGLHLKVDTAE